MRPLSRRVLLLSEPIICSKGPLAVGQAVSIGQFQEAGPSSLRSFSRSTVRGINNNSSKRGARRWQGRFPQGTILRRLKSTWDGQFEDIATSPRRSNAAPLLGVLFGASALAFLGSSISAQFGVEDKSVESDGAVDIVDAEGRSSGG